MTTSAAAERRFLSRDEMEVVGASHYPRLAEADAAALRDTRSRLRDLRDKAGTVARHKRREARGKAAPRAGGASGDSEHSARRKQIFSQALQRTSRQLQRLEHAEAVSRTTTGMQRALALKADGTAPRRRPPRTPGHARQPQPSASDGGQSGDGRARVAGWEGLPGQARHDPLKPPIAGSPASGRPGRRVLR